MESKTTTTNNNTIPRCPVCGLKFVSGETLGMMEEHMIDCGCILAKGF